MKNLSRFKVDKNSLVYGEYQILIRPQTNITFQNWLQFVVFYKKGQLFCSGYGDHLEDIVETVFELEKDDNDSQDRESFRSCLNKILERNCA